MCVRKTLKIYFCLVQVQLSATVKKWPHVTWEGSLIVRIQLTLRFTFTMMSDLASFSLLFWFHGLQQLECFWSLHSFALLQWKALINLLTDYRSCLAPHRGRTELVTGWWRCRNQNRAKRRGWLKYVRWLIAAINLIWWIHVFHACCLLPCFQVPTHLSLQVWVQIWKWLT